MRMPITAALVLLLAAPRPADAARYAFDDKTGSVTFTMEASLHGIEGAAQNFTGELDIGSASPSGKLTIQAQQITTFLGVRDDRMHSYCLETDRYPTVDFQIAAVTGDVKGLNSRRGSGQLQLRGQMTVRSSTRDVVVPATYSWEGDTLRLRGSHQLLWPDYGVPDPSIVISTLLPEVDVSFDVKMKPAP